MALSVSVTRSLLFFLESDSTTDGSASCIIWPAVYAMDMSVSRISIRLCSVNMQLVSMAAKSPGEEIIGDEHSGVGTVDTSELSALLFSDMARAVGGYERLEIGVAMVYLEFEEAELLEKVEKPWR